MKIMIEKKDMLETDIDSFPVNLLLVVCKTTSKHILKTS